MTEPRALGRPYDDSADQPLPAMPEPPAVASLADDIGAAAAAVDVDEPAAEPAVEPRNGAPRKIDITNETEAVRALRRALVAGALPDVYARRGELVQVTEVAGIGADELPYVSARVIEPSTLRRLLGKHAYCYVLRKKERKVDAPLIEVEASPAVQTCRDLLDEREWHGVRHLRGVSLVPILRPDGTLVQARGYDEATGVYYAPLLDIGHVPARPAPDHVDEARDFVLGRVLGDFPWVDKSDLANYLALLITPILRPYLRGALSPLGAITAASAGTGKTLLAGDIPQALYGLTSRPWVGDEAEVRKSITTVLTASSKPVVLFDNVPEGEPIKSAMLAKLLTSQQWDDRELGSNAAVEALNDRLWLATGNAIEVGGDMPSRTVLVRLDANMARPDLRQGFQIPDLKAWLTDADNAAQLLRALLVLIMDWVNADRPAPEPFALRQFGRWATACGDFLAHHGVPLFLDNLGALQAADDEGAEWLAFVSEWHEKFGSSLKTAVELSKSAEPEFVEGFRTDDDPWHGRFLYDNRGRPRNSRSLSKALRAHKGKVFASGTVGGYKIESPDKLERDNVRRYRVVLVDETTGGVVETPEPAVDKPAAPAPTVPAFVQGEFDVDERDDDAADDD